ncbi:spondin-1-like isoform X2 [Phymastichus coffea]|uniref:spondin-1-like isoform X2 n=1 Tax=Phymastichus coffea TaxID=108790 RepID=UPI00273AA7A7|nr:spondin-1-like isoform X2 [Phymastichus coffea]
MIRLALMGALLCGASGWMHCESKWDDVKGPHIVGDHYHVLLLKINSTEQFKSFMPNTKYQVMIQSKDADSTFARFHLTVENENKTLSPGTFELYDNEITEFSQDCPEVIAQTSNIAKNDASAYWTSPAEGNGCVIFRGMVMESQERWYMDGSLEQKICQDPKALIDEPGPELPECCACEEAKYEITFEGLWSRYTHPKNFPSNPWSAGFSDVIGASHTSDYHFWKYNDEASEGLKQVAESGITRILESELKNKSAHIRTIIKAKGINFPNITSKTFAVFRVDQRHHLISLVSMIDPSPDWFVGVSGLELCLANCSWVEHKELNLYPIDAGTDDGVGYESPDAPTQPQSVIRRITTSWPEDEGSPFYEPTAVDMNPLARLYLNRQRIYEKDCERQEPGVENAGGDDDSANETGGNAENNEGDANDEQEPVQDKACTTTAWSDWQPCSVTCGHGHKLRQRSYLNEPRASKHGCNEKLTQRDSCWPVDPDGGRVVVKCPPDEVVDPNCNLGQWSDWTPCTRRCGPQKRTRDRKFKPKKNRKKCRADHPDIHLQETDYCPKNPRCAGESTEAATEEGEEANGGAQPEEPSVDTSEEQTTCVEERYTEWSFWTPCSVSCGMGTKTHSRSIKPEYMSSPEAEKDLSLYACQFETTSCEAETKSCEITKELMKVICSQPEQLGSCLDGHNDNSLRYYYDKRDGKCKLFRYSGCNGNMNNFRTMQECQATCGKFHDLGGPRSYKLKVSSIASYNVPLSFDRDALKAKRDKSEEEASKKKRRKKPRGSDKQKVDCKVSEWSDWSPCYSCKGHRTMNRQVLVEPKNDGKPCPAKLIKKQRCQKVLPECAEQAMQSYQDFRRSIKFDGLEDRSFE